MEMKLATTASVFGAALASMLVAPELQAQTVSTGAMNPGSIGFNFTGSGTGLVALSLTALPGGAHFSQWNDYVGRTMLVGGGGYINSFGTVQQSQTLLASQAGWAYGFSPPNNASGTAFIGFHTVGGNVGWFHVSFGGFGGAVVYTKGGWDPNGGNVHVGTVPAPGALALLAMGAVGIRRKRKRAA